MTQHIIFILLQVFCNQAFLSSDPSVSYKSSVSTNKLQARY
jgi:hypothetical protein